MASSSTPGHPKPQPIPAATHVLQKRTQVRRQPEESTNTKTQVTQDIRTLEAMTGPSAPTPLPSGHQPNGLPNLPSLPPAAMAAIIVSFFMLLIISIAAINVVVFPELTTGVLWSDLGRPLGLNEQSVPRANRGRYATLHYEPSGSALSSNSSSGDESECYDATTSCDSALTSPTSATFHGFTSPSPLGGQSIFRNRQKTPSLSSLYSSQTLDQIEGEEAFIKHPIPQLYPFAPFNNLLQTGCRRGCEIMSDKVNNIVGAVANGIVKWTTDTGDEEGLLLSVTEKERSACVEI